MVFTGLLSYSLYLWHAPILAFFSYYRINDPGGATLCSILALIYLISLGSWAAIEQPFRTKALARSPSSFVSLALVSAVALAGCGYWFARTEGLAQRWNDSAATASVTDPAAFASIDSGCFNTPLDKIAAGELCSFGPQNDSAKKVVVWGDSHAYALLPAYQSLAIAEGIRIYFGIKGACWPLVGFEAASSGEFYRARCANFNAAMVKAISRLDPTRVILNAYWLDPGAAAEPEFGKRTAQAQTQVIDGIRRTLQQVQSPGRSVCAILTVPGYDYPIPYALAMAKRRHLDAAALSVTRAEALREYQTVEGSLRLLASQKQLRVADPKDVLCPASGCLIETSDGTPLYRDANHMSIRGALELSGILQQCLSDLQ